MWSLQDPQPSKAPAASSNRARGVARAPPIALCRHSSAIAYANQEIAHEFSDYRGTCQRRRAYAPQSAHPNVARRAHCSETAAHGLAEHSGDGRAGGDGPHRYLVRRRGFAALIQAHRRSATMAKPVAIVVGVGAELGLGAALCRRFAEGGHHVLVAGRSADKIEQVVRTIASKGGSAEAVPTDATR